MNQYVRADELAQIRMLDDFDLTMLISEIHDHGWPVASHLLSLMVGRLPATQEGQPGPPGDGGV